MNIVNDKGIKCIKVGVAMRAMWDCSWYHKKWSHCTTILVIPSTPSHEKALPNNSAFLYLYSLPVHSYKGINLNI